MTNPDGPSPPWRAALDFDAQPADHYLDHWNESLMTFVEGSPRRALEAGCAGGLFGAKLKERVPGVHVTGIEAGRAAAELAATRLDRVIHAPLESVDFAAAAIGPGSLDLVVVADVLEHLVDPWGFLAKARPLLAPGGRLLASLPNVRNLNLLLDLLLAGRWRYQERGLLDVTHLRFFAFEDMRQLFADTGFAVDKYGATLSKSLAPTWQQHQHQDTVNLAIGRLSLQGVDRAELMQLCTEQFLFSCRPA